jgi:hypothetical protein
MNFKFKFYEWIENMMPYVNHKYCCACFGYYVHAVDDTESRAIK